MTPLATSITTHPKVIALHQTLLEGAIGLGAVLAGTAISHIDRVEQDLRIAAIVGGLLVSLLTSAKIIRDWKRKGRG